MTEYKFPITIELSEPLKVGKNGTTLDRLEIRQPRIGDLRGITVQVGMDFDSILKIAQRIVTNFPQGEEELYMDRIPAEDGDLLMRVARDFLMRCCQ